MNNLLDPPFTPEEREVMDLLVEAHNKFLALEPKTERMAEWVLGIHLLQQLCIQRMLKRLYPEYFR